MKVKNRLLNFSDNIIYQDDDYFAFSLDSVLLANFVTIKLSDKKIIDFCTGNAPIPMLLTYKTKNESIDKKIVDIKLKYVDGTDEEYVQAGENIEELISNKQIQFLANKYSGIFLLDKNNIEIPYTQMVIHNG